MPPSIDRSGAGDPVRTLELLWRHPGAPSSHRGPRHSLTVDEVVDAAIAIADAEGLAAVTMRRVAQRLGVGAMSLYTYVPGKAELLDLMLDTVFGRMPRPGLSGLPWRERLAAIARANRDLYERHPWVSAVSTTRPPLGPGLLAKYEYELRAFEGLGLDDVEMDDALSYLLGFVHASARAAADARAFEHEGALTDQQWWEASAPMLAQVFDAEKYPTAARVGAAAGEAHNAAYAPGHAYEFGLRRVLDGLGVLIEQRRAPVPPAGP
ncbi:TetR family transcriptional regulator [Sphaerisporangium melleum]|uniref:TetR family transcriptional regulator n=1 Tax=Sphaerisporangium melleum TaxID=321316 RepID=A0A917RID8_9ACTN|nr:TetR/AcrR family transcriptional regulator [Sphaerisporangium melleum]GGL07994.1 TetR family transcriptional regulator [Sphaerisporangium melleum]GII74291.1 TetR family transcriptional regulator [Sphaerisporangium melleum]